MSFTPYTVNPDLDLELRPNGTGGCEYRAIAVHQDAKGRAQHDSMGFHMPITRAPSRPPLRRRAVLWATSMV